MVVAFVVLDDSVPRPSIQFYLVHLTILVIFLIHLYGLHSSLNRWIQQNQKEHSDMSSECSSFVSLISFHSFLRWHFPSGNDASIRSPPSPGAPGRIFGCRFCFLADLRLKMTSGPTELREKFTGNSSYLSYYLLDAG